MKSNKNDFVEAEAICKTASRPAKWFVTPKTESQHTLSAQHRMRDSLQRDFTKTSNQVQGFLLEFGISLPVGNAAFKRLPTVIAEHELPPRLIAIVEGLHAHLKSLGEQIREIDKEITHPLAHDDLGKRLLTISGIGPVTASVLAAERGEGKQYGCSQDFAASIGLVPRQSSTGGKANPLARTALALALALALAAHHTVIAQDKRELDVYLGLGKH